MATTLLVIALARAVLALVFFVVGYNQPRAAGVRVAEALSGIDVELTRRASLIPSLVHTVQTFATHEKGILAPVTNARAALTAAASGKSVAQRSAAEKDLDSALAPPLALGQNYPQLSFSNNFLNLHDNLADTENKLAFACQYYNDAVATLNRLITTIPWTFVALLTGVSEREYYQTPRGARPRRWEPSLHWRGAHRLRRDTRTRPALVAPVDRVAAPRCDSGSHPS